MKQALQEYCQAIDERADRLGREEEACRRTEHLRAFNLGRVAQRAERSRREARLCIFCLLTGLVIGIAGGRASSAAACPALAQRFVTGARVVVKTAGKTGLASFLRNLRTRS